MSEDFCRFVVLINLAVAFLATGIMWACSVSRRMNLHGGGFAGEEVSPRRRKASLSRSQWTTGLLNCLTIVLLLQLSAMDAYWWFLSLSLLWLAVLAFSAFQSRSRNGVSSATESSAGNTSPAVESRGRTPILFTGVHAMLVFWMTWIYLTSPEGRMMKTKLKVGDPAPAFTATSADGQRISLADFLGKQGLVIFFYPKDGTAVCTKEACAFRDSYEKFVDAHVEVIGVSADSDASHQSFAGTHKLSFPLISDADGSLRKAFGVEKTFGIIPGRVTYVIDKQGIVRLIYSAQLASDEHVKKALAAVGETTEPPDGGTNQ